MIDADDIGDLTTNILACVANDISLKASQDELMSSIPIDTEINRQFEYFFNKSLVTSRSEDLGVSIVEFLDSYDRAQKEGASDKDIFRFRVQELHILANLRNSFSRLTYKDPARVELASE